MSRRTYDDDDGRTIADMSDVYVRTPLGYRSLDGKRRRETEPAKEEKKAPWEESGTSKEERRSYIWGALSAALLIALAFIVGLGLVILLIVLAFR